ncbi:hypothetical protein [Aeribacillus sp. FSL k6-2211]|jgi:hypothetical protein|uniref:hypothetical protein n=1 Tax=Aeribacillus sp. FSL k6-2211 TaxID=2954608 RepID=UPI0030D4295B
MDKDTFFTMTPEERVKKVNELLQKYELKEIADLIGIPYSTFTKEMRKDDYFYHQTDRKYYRFIRDEKNIKGKYSDSEVLSFIQENFDTLKSLIQNYKSSSFLLLDERVYRSNANFVNKSIKMNSEIYEEFSKFCEDNYPQYQLQHLVAQALIDFMNKYKR